MGVVGVVGGNREFLGMRRFGCRAVYRECLSMRRKHDLRSIFILSLLWFLALIFIYGPVGTSDIETAADLTAEVDRAEVMAWAR